MRTGPATNCDSSPAAVASPPPPPPPPPPAPHTTATPHPTSSPLPPRKLPIQRIQLIVLFPRRQIRPIQQILPLPRHRLNRLRDRHITRVFLPRRQAPQYRRPQRHRLLALGQRNPLEQHIGVNL